MKLQPAHLLLCPALLCSLNRVAAQTSPYDPVKTFAPLSLPDPVNSYRSSNGSPGPDYWQNSADYEIHANLDTSAKVLRATETIRYTNNSPDELPSLWLQLDQNIYRKDSRASEMAARPRADFSDGFVIDSIAVENGTQKTTPDYVVSDTRMQIRLAHPLKGKASAFKGSALKGSSLTIDIAYHYAIPGTWGGRTSWGKAQHGEIYDIAQWYPRMAVYDDLHGWDTLALPRVGVLSGIRTVRLLRDRAVQHDPGRLGRAR